MAASVDLYLRGVGFLLVPFSWTKTFPTQQPRCLFFVTVVFLGSSISVTLKNHQNPQAPDPKIALPAPWRRCFTWRRRGCPMLSREIRRSGSPTRNPREIFFLGGRTEGQQNGPSWILIFVGQFLMMIFPSYVLCTDLWWRHKWSSRMVAGPVGYCAQLLLQAAKGESALPLHCGDRNIGWFRWIKCWLNFEWPSFRPYNIMDENSWKLQTTQLDTSGDFLRLPSVFHVGMWFVGRPLVQEHQELSDQSKAALEERADLVARIEQEIFFGVKSTKMPGF